MSRWRAVGVATLAVALASGALVGQGVRIAAPSGQVGVALDGAWSDFEGVRGARFAQFAEWLDIGVAGVVVDPRVASFALHLRPTWLQVAGRQVFDTAPSSDATRLTNYGVSATAFPLMPVSGSAWFTRISGRRPGLFGSSSASDVGRAGASIRLRNPPLPVTFEIERVARVDSQYRLTGNVRTRHDVLTEAGVRARNSKLDAELRRQSFDDRQGVTDQQSWIGDVVHRFGWGKGSSITSGLHTIERTGFLPVRQVRWEERLMLQHTRAVSTQWQYSQFTHDAPVGRISGRALELAAAAALRPDLQAGLDGRATWSRFPEGRRSEVRAIPRLAWSRNLSQGGLVRAHLGLGYEWLSQDNADGGITVLDERHVVDFSGRFRLDQAFVDSLTIVITDVTQTIVYQAGLDYRVVPTGQLTEILTLPTGSIIVGDTLLVDYRYQLGPSGRSAGSVSSYGASVTWRPVEAYAYRDQRSPRQLEGALLALAYDFVTAGVAVRGSLGGVSATGRAEYQRREYDGTDVDIHVLSGTVSGALASALTGSLSGAVSRQRGDLTLDNTRGDLTLGWTPSGYFRLGVRGTVWSWRQGPVRRESFVGGGIDAEWRVGKMQTRASYSRGWWDNGSHNMQHLLSLGVIRNF